MLTEVLLQAEIVMVMMPAQVVFIQTKQRHRLVCAAHSTLTGIFVI